MCEKETALTNITETMTSVMAGMCLAQTLIMNCPLTNARRFLGKHLTNGRNGLFPEGRARETEIAEWLLIMHSIHNARAEGHASWQRQRE
jgi:hypothetical protein